MTAARVKVAEVFPRPEGRRLFHVEGAKDEREAGAAVARLGELHPEQLATAVQIEAKADPDAPFIGVIVTYRAGLMDPLETATTDELLDELKRRYGAVVVVGVRDAPAGDDADHVDIFYAGGLTVAIGLAERARDQFCRDARRGMRREK